MKYALFEFVNEKSCEIGETRWILREEEENFENDGWDCNKEVMVLWPRDFSKVHKKIVKGCIDPLSIATITCVAKVLRFSDDYDTIRLHMVQYCETGSLKTPNHGRGKRAPRPNGKYASSEDENEEQVVIEKPSKRSKTNASKSAETPSQNELEALKAKYKFSQKKIVHTNQDFDAYEEDDCVFEDEIKNFKKENCSLRNKLIEQEKEIKHLQLVISNLKAMPSLEDLVADLNEHIKILKNGQRYLTPRPEKAMASSSSGTSTTKSSSDSDVELEMVSLCPNIVLAKGQHKSLAVKSSLKDFVYAAMGMLWSREVLCTHSITGRASNAFKEKEAKPQLDPEKVQSLCEYGAKRFGCKPSEVRHVMTTRINNVIKVEKAKQKGPNEQ